MEKTRSKMQVLRAYRPIARTLTTYNLDNFTGGKSKSRRTIGWNVVTAIGCTVSFVLIAGLALINARFGCDATMKWRVRAYHFVIMLCLTHQLLIFVATTRSSRRMLDTLDQLQRSVDGRKCFSSKKFTFSIQIVWFDISDSTQQGLAIERSNAIYEQIEPRYRTYFNKANVGLCVTIASMYLDPLRQPISYAIFGHPEPSEWILPNGYR